MGTFTIDTTTTPGVLRCRFSGTLTVEEVTAFVVEHNAAVRKFGNADYRVFVDLRDMLPLPPAATAVMEESKRFSSGRKNFRGSAVLVKSSIVGLQHRRTSVEAGVLNTEFTSESEEECWAFLQKVARG